MKTTYKSTFYSMLGIILIVLITALTGCKKSENENPQPIPTPVVVTPTTYDTFVLTSYNNEDSVNVNDTIYRISNDVVKFSAPIHTWKGTDTMELEDESKTLSGIVKYTINHYPDGDGAYVYKGTAYMGTSDGINKVLGAVCMSFQRKLAVTPHTIVKTYKLTYIKI